MLASPEGKIDLAPNFPMAAAFLFVHGFPFIPIRRHAAENFPIRRSTNRLLAMDLPLPN